MTRWQAKELERCIPELIRAHGGRMYQAQIAKHFTYQPSTVKNYLHRLRAQGVLERFKGPYKVYWMVRGDSLDGNKSD